MSRHMIAIGVLSVAVIVLGLPGAGRAEKEGEKEMKTEIPATAAGIWQAVLTHETALGKLVAEKKLDKVHEFAFAIRDLVNALPGKSADLPADKLAKVKTNAKYVVDLADRLDKAGDANDQAATAVSFTKLQGILKTIAAQYPSTVTAIATIYTCPMHPEVAADKPGKCPKCGMNLVEKK